MATNIEIKAHLKDFAAAQAAAKALSDAPLEIIHQEDVFFPTPHGRLKLRILSSDRGQLIYYERPDLEGPKASEYFIAETGQPQALRHVLESAYGVRGVVRKERHLYLAGRTRIHLDKVEKLGYFLELEVVLETGEGHVDGQRIAAELMHRLGIGPDDLIEGAYIDLMETHA